MEQLGIRKSEEKRAWALALAAGLMLSLLSSCNNNRLQRNLASTTEPDPLAKVVTDVSTQSTITLSRVLKNAQSPSSTFDLIGDGTGAIGQACSPDGATSGSDVSNCNCNYEYTTASGTLEQFDAPTNRYEANLIRCLYTGVPTSITEIKVRIHVVSQDVYSNQVRFTFNTSATTLDTSSSSSFLKVERYMCRDKINASGIMSNNVYDPFQSDDFTDTDRFNSYTYNYYTTDLGTSLTHYAGGVGAFPPQTDFYCPSLTNDPLEKFPTRIYSETADPSGGKIIDNSVESAKGTTISRSTFYLAKKASGVFNVPVNAMVAPNIYSITPDAQGNTEGAQPIGYGASPISLGVPLQEKCPDSSIQIPTGYHWVKVWLFRGTLPSRKLLQPAKLQYAGHLVCSPSDKYSDGTDIFTKCSSGVHISELSTTNVGGLASRALASSTYNQFTYDCLHFDPDEFTGFGPGVKNSSNVNDYFPLGTDHWNIAASTAPVTATNVGTFSTALDPEPVIALDMDGGVPRYDFLFVVTPTTVMSGQIANSLAYKPYRFLNQNDCNSDDPEAAGCDLMKAVHYGVKLHEVGTAGDPPAGDNRGGSFPVCALQPD